MKNERLQILIVTAVLLVIAIFIIGLDQGLFTRKKSADVGVEKTEKVLETNIQTHNLDPNQKVSYEFAINAQNSNTKGGRVEWNGVISDKTQIDGIKFWIFDEDHPASIWDYYEWFWGAPDYTKEEELFEINNQITQNFSGNWVNYMMKRYGVTKSDGVDWSGIYRITGSFNGADCDYYDQKDRNGNQVCIPNVVVEKIEHLSSLPTFEKYPVSETAASSSYSPLDLNSHPVGIKFKTILTNAYDGSPNFAGHYTVVDYGCGANCQRFVIIDNITGIIYQTNEFVSELGIDFQLESNLLIVNPSSTLDLYRIDNENRKRNMAVWERFSSRYYKWTNNELTLIYP
ncbi:hypothetical protein HN858_03940 [Candidatus Falkowbacteria bacterium]|jgi:hypothetical protein|nr:hypothetical protein [Candidatus Falkowbacteria bacterium]MBT7501235.1 hypothetical protein [Candidatus Falkowbacteria bacterium]